MDLFNLLFILVLILIVSYWYFTRTHNHWTKQNVPSVPDPIPAFGHALPLIILKESLGTLTVKLYRTTNTSVIGFHLLQRPALMVRDPELIKNVLQTNFSSFSSNFLLLDEEVDPILSKNPFLIRDVHKWKESRARTVSYLSGKKLSYLCLIIQEVCSKMSAYVERKIQENGGFLECELKGFFIKYTGEVVANAAFGIEGQSFKDNPDQWAFVNVAKTIFTPTLINGLKQSLIFYLPTIASFLKLKFAPQKAENYFRENLLAIIKQRKQANAAPNDFLQFCLDSNPEGDIESIVGDAILFYSDVYETSSTVLSALFYHLSQNKVIQEKVRAHIVSTLKDTNGTVTYESLKNMGYLEQTIFESMRVTPPLGSMIKICTENITLHGSDGIKCNLRLGDPIFIPIMGLNSDPQHWSDPEIFDPDRFSPENQASRHKYVFLPFGEGPRMCVGMRLGLMLVKLAATSLLTKYSVEYSTKTKVPLELNPGSFLTYIKGGLWAKFVKLNDNS